MARGKKIEFTLKKINITFHCSKCNKNQKVEVTEHDFTFWVDEHEFGTSGSLEVNVKCLECNNSRDIELKSL